MNVERHYDDEALIALMETNHDDADTHLLECPSCREKLQSARLVAASLTDASVWDNTPLSDEPSSSTIAMLRAFANRLADDGVHAEARVSHLLGEPVGTWRARLEAHPESWSEGLVRSLIEAASRAVDTMPSDAVEIATLAGEIADRLLGNPLFHDERLLLRGAARRELAYALYYTGRFAEALDETDRADELFGGCSVAAYEQARVDIVRSLVLRALERWTEALNAARHSVAVFEEFGDADRAASARVAEAQVLFSLRDFSGAIALLSSQERELRASDRSSHTYAVLLSNLAYAFWQQGRTADAMSYYDAASAILSELGVETEALRIRWSLATMLVDGGHAAEALRRLREIAPEFAKRGMTCEAALAGLGIAELLLAEGKFEEIEELCIRAIRSFEAAGVSYTAKAFTALAYLREASRNRVATPKLVRHVRDYIRRLPAEETLLFAPP